ncbi:MAG: AAA family ATPase [Muribaculaceae bacterium]|nr:AAA family ATPase [Muribaculaceae bacterium]MDE6447120.1 AAA family ATPase [Muribaculaceae bacterium]MDE7342484.1 AAA family ATPase [Muribaculaceae bacterium]
MLYRKIEELLKERLSQPSERVPVVSGARQIGKSYIIRYVGQQLFKNFIELNLIEDNKLRDNLDSVRTVEEFYLALSSFVGMQLGNADDTLIFIDEIQECPHLLTLLKFLRQDNRYRYIASGSLLGLTLHHTHSIPVGSMETIAMYPLDFEEFLIANDCGRDVIDYLRGCFENMVSPVAAVHNRIMDLFRRYLLVGGLPAAVNEFLASRNLAKVRAIQSDIHMLYSADASKYDELHRLKIKRIYDLIPSNMENKKKRVVYRDIEEKKGKRSADYEEEMEYLISSGIALEVKAISNPKFPLAETESKNLLKLYLNDVGLLSDMLFRLNPRPILEDEASINLGALYECVVATELAAHGHRLFYYDNRKYGEVDYLIDDFSSLSVVPLEVKSGRDYRIHAALTRFLSTPDYNIKKGYVLSNSGEVATRDGIRYVPVYMVMFFNCSGGSGEDIFI